MNLFYYYFLDQAKSGNCYGATVFLNNTLHLGSFQDLSLVVYFFQTSILCFCIPVYDCVYVWYCLVGKESFVGFFFFFN